MATVGYCQVPNNSSIEKDCVELLELYKKNVLISGSYDGMQPLSQQLEEKLNTLKGKYRINNVVRTITYITNNDARFRPLQSSIVINMATKPQPLHLVIKPDNQAYAMGDKITLTVNIKNVADKEMIVFWNDKEPDIFSEIFSEYYMVMNLRSNGETLYIKPNQIIKKTITIPLKNGMEPYRGRLKLILLYDSQNLELNFQHMSDQEIFTGVLISNTITIEVVEKRKK